MLVLSGWVNCAHVCLSEGTHRHCEEATFSTRLWCQFERQSEPHFCLQCLQHCLIIWSVLSCPAGRLHSAWHCQRNRPSRNLCVIKQAQIKTIAGEDDTYQSCLGHSKLVSGPSPASVFSWFNLWGLHGYLCDFPGRLCSSEKRNEVISIRRPRKHLLSPSAVTTTMSSSSKWTICEAEFS